MITEGNAEFPRDPRGLPGLGCWSPYFLCSLGNILDVGAEGTVQGGDVGAFGTVAQGGVMAFGTVDQKDVVAAGTIRKSVSAVGHQSLVISPGLKVSDPMLGVGDGRCAGDIQRAQAHPRQLQRGW